MNKKLIVLTICIINQTKKLELKAPYLSDELYLNTYGTSKRVNKLIEKRTNQDCYTLLTHVLNKFSLFKKITPLLASPSSSNNSLDKAMDTSSTRFKYIPRLINNVFGIEPPKKYRPLVHMMGPIMHKSYSPLDANTESFLNSRKQVAFIAFGQHAKPTSEDLKMIIYGLLRLLESGHIDGVIWAGLNKSRLTSSNIQTPYINGTYSYQDLINHPDLYLADWVPQFAVLQHPSVSFFITHGGVGSLHEAFYSGKRVFIFPFFGDQHPNGESIEHYGFGKHFDTLDMKYDTACYESFYDSLYQITVDPDNTIQDNVNRYSAYVQIRANNAVSRGADVLEECLFASDSNGHLTYLEESSFVDQETHWIWSYSIDFYTVIILLFSFILFKKGILFNKTN